MELQQIHPKELIFSSTDQGVLFNKSYDINVISFKIGELEKLYKLEQEVVWQNVLTKIHGLHKSLINYQSEEGLTLYGKQFNDKILVISTGEKNRGIFQLYVEGIWQINKNL